MADRNIILSILGTLSVLEIGILLRIAVQNGRLEERIDALIDRITKLEGKHP